MRLNEYQNDPLSEGQPGLAIAGRWDLAANKEKFQLDGAIDAKACNVELARRLMFVAQNGKCCLTDLLLDHVVTLT
jgi:hypothetical protein